MRAAWGPSVTEMKLGTCAIVVSLTRMSVDMDSIEKQGDTTARSRYPGRTAIEQDLIHVMMLSAVI